MGNLHRNICVLILLPVPHAVPKECLHHVTRKKKTKRSSDCICVIYLLIENRAVLECDPETSVITAAAHTFTKERTHNKVGHCRYSVNSLPASQRTHSVSIIKQLTVLGNGM